jgi:hypothetical protein
MPNRRKIALSCHPGCDVGKRTWWFLQIWDGSILACSFGGSFEILMGPYFSV